MTRVLNHIRKNLVGYIALFAALGGTSYAAVTISGSQIRNRTINAIKLNPDTISASIRAWVIVYAGSDSASIGASSTRVQVRATSSGETIAWPHRRFAPNC